MPPCIIWKNAASGDAAYNGAGIASSKRIGGPFGLAQGRLRPPLQEGQ